MTKIRTLLLLTLPLLVAACSVNNDPVDRVSRAVTGVALAPLLSVARLEQSQSLVASLFNFFSSPSQADVTGTVGFAAVPVGTPVELVRFTVDFTNTPPVTETVIPCDGACPVTDVNGNFTLYTSEPPSSTLGLRVSFMDGGTPVTMRAMVYGDLVNVTPVSEAVFQQVGETLDPNIYNKLSNFTPNEIGSVVRMMEDQDTDFRAMGFTESINTIKASELLTGFISGFKTFGDLNITNPNDIFHIVELRNRLIEPDATFTEGAVDYEATTGGAVSFDQNGDFQSGSALYYWGLRASFLDTPPAPVRLFDQSLNEINQNPNAGTGYDIYLTYGVPVGFNGIVGSENGMAVAHSSTESSTVGFISNDGGLMAFLSERNDDVLGVYDHGLRVMMRKWKVASDDYNDLYANAFNNNTINFADGINGTNNNNGNTVTSSIDLNPIMDPTAGAATTNYNVINYQHFLNDSGIEIGIGTGVWAFDTNSQRLITDSVGTSESYGQTAITSQNLSVNQYDYATGTLTGSTIKPIEACPNRFSIEYGGAIQFRRDGTTCTGAFSGSGTVTSDGGLFIVPQVYDDDEDNQALELTMTLGNAARRGWYVGLRQPTVALTDANLDGTYHVVGQLTELDDTIDSVSHQTFSGTMAFSALDGSIRANVYNKSTTMDSIYTGDALTPQVQAGQARLVTELNGTYATVADGTVAITLPNITDAVTGIAGQILTDPNTNADTAMFIAIPITRESAGKSTRGIMLLSHEHILPYPVPPDPPL